MTVPSREERVAEPRGRHLFTLLAAVVLAHLPALFAGFTYDDRDFFVRNLSIRSFAGAAAALLAPFPANDPARGLFRPLTNSSYALDFALGRGSAFVPHLTNLLLYAAAVVLLYRLLRRLGEGERAALFAALLFAVHPVHCEAVDSIAGRAELLSLVFTLLAVSVYVRDELAPSLPAACLAALWYALAAASKESGLCLPLLLGAYALARDGRLRRPRLIALSMLGVVAVGYLALRVHVLSGMGPRTTILGDAPWSTRILTIGSVFLEYARLLLWPVELAPDYGYTHSVGISHGLGVRPVLGLLLLLVAGAAMIRAMRQRRSTQALGWLFLAVYLLPVSHLVPFGALLAERFLLVPSVGLVMLLIPLLRRAQVGEGGVTRLASAAMVVLLVVLGARSFARARDWHDDVSLWTPVEARIKNDARIYNNLALGYMQQGDAERSLWATRRSLALLPDNRIALSNLGEVLMATGKLDEARASYERTIQLWPDYAVAHFNLAVLELRTGRVARARVQLAAALRANPNYATARALSQQADALYARAQAFLAAARATSGNGSRSFAPAEVAAACRAVGDDACEASMRAPNEPRAPLVPPQTAP